MTTQQGGSRRDGPLLDTARRLGQQVTTALLDAIRACDHEFEAAQGNRPNADVDACVGCGYSSCRECRGLRVVAHDAECPRCGGMGVEL